MPDLRISPGFFILIFSHLIKYFLNLPLDVNIKNILTPVIIAEIVLNQINQRFS